MNEVEFYSLKNEAKDLFDLHLNDEEMKALFLYAQELLLWNQKFNLTAIREESEIRRKHFLDSISCLQADLSGKVIDVGTGAGFPGLVLRILSPEIELSLAESISKKTQFLSHIVQVLGLKNVSVLTERAEKLGQDPLHREKYDWAVARALAKLPVLLEYLLPLVKMGGFVLAQKGKHATEEVLQAEIALTVLGGEITEILPIDIPGLEERSLVIVKKIAQTPEKYPRREGIPSKRPL